MVFMVCIVMVLKHNSTKIHTTKYIKVQKYCHLKLYITENRGYYHITSSGQNYKSFLLHVTMQTNVRFCFSMPPIKLYYNSK